MWRTTGKAGRASAYMRASGLSQLSEQSARGRAFFWAPRVSKSVRGRAFLGPTRKPERAWAPLTGPLVPTPALFCCNSPKRATRCALSGKLCGGARLLLRDFEKYGVHLEAPQRSHVARLTAEIHSLGMLFSKAFRHGNFQMDHVLSPCLETPDLPVTGQAKNRACYQLTSVLFSFLAGVLAQ